MCCRYCSSMPRRRIRGSHELGGLGRRVRGYRRGAVDCQDMASGAREAKVSLVSLLFRRYFSSNLLRGGVGGGPMRKSSRSGGMRVLPGMFDVPATAPMESVIQARDAAIERSEANASDEFNKAALDAVWWSASRHESFISDEVWAEMPDYIATHDNRAMGPAIKKAQSLGWIKPTDSFRTSARPHCHGNPRRIWRSLIYKGV